MRNPKVYDAKGNLVRVMYPDFELYKQYFNANSDHPEFSLIARIAYAENEYDIQSADNKTNHYIKNQLGLEKLTASEQKRQDKSAKQMAKAAEGYVRDQMKYGNIAVREELPARNMPRLSWVQCSARAADIIATREHHGSVR